MKRLSTPFLGAAVLAGLAAASGVAQADPVLRVQVDQHGDFLLIGNTLGFECANEPGKPPVGDIAENACGQPGKSDDSSPDLFWRSDEPTAGKAMATTWTPDQARTTAMLSVPQGAKVTHAFLYWAAKNTSNAAGTTVLLERPGTALQQTITSSKGYVATTGNAYESVADVTPIVQQHGSGPYRVSGIAATPFANVDDGIAFGAWVLVAFYELPSESLRNLALFDGMDAVSIQSHQTVTLNGFVVPNAGYDGKLGVIAYEGDADTTGDQLLFDDTPLSNDWNPVDNFFNSTRSWHGEPLTVPGDLPQLSGKPRTMAGVDIDVVDITNLLTSGQTSAALRVNAGFDQIYLGAFVTSITTFRPDFSTSTKTVRDVNGGSVVPGDILEFTITATNTGNDAAVKTFITDSLPPSLTYVPGSISIAAGANAGNKTDMAGDDVAEYIAAEHKIVVRVGTGADAINGGAIPKDASAVVRFRAMVKEGVVGTITNQAIVSAGGAIGAPVTETYTDGNGPDVGNPPTSITVDQCESNAQCSGTTPICDTSVSPKVCVACVRDSDCGGAASGKVCAEDHTCIDGCRGTGGNGCPTGTVCTSTTNAVGYCVECVTDSDCGGATSGRICITATNTCVNGCRGTGGNRCPAGDVCTSVDTTPGLCVDCLTDADCGDLTSGRVCDSTTQSCRDGCRATGGNHCAPGIECTSTDSSIGYCVLDGGTDAGGDASDAGPPDVVADVATDSGAPDVVEDAGRPDVGEAAAGGRGGNPWDEIVAQGNGVSCSAANSRTAPWQGRTWLLGSLLALGCVLRRSRRPD